MDIIFADFRSSCSLVISHNYDYQWRRRYEMGRKLLFLLHVVLFSEKLSPCLKQYTSCRFIGRIISCLRATYNSSETLWWRKNTTFYSIALQKLLFIAPIEELIDENAQYGVTNSSDEYAQIICIITQLEIWFVIQILFHATLP